jgi:hypothetical protein
VRVDRKNSNGTDRQEVKEIRTQMEKRVKQKGKKLRFANENKKRK